MRVYIEVPDSFVDDIEIGSGMMPRLVVTDPDVAKTLVRALTGELVGVVDDFESMYCNRTTEQYNPETLKQVHDEAQNMLRLTAALFYATTDTTSLTEG
jgi:hypothetical protein